MSDDRDDTETKDAPESTGPGDSAQDSDQGEIAGENNDDAQDYVDRSKIDFDPDEGHYSGTAVDGSTDIPGPHEEADDIEGETGDKPSDATSAEADGDEAPDQAAADEKDAERDDPAPEKDA